MADRRQIGYRMRRVRRRARAVADDPAVAEAMAALDQAEAERQPGTPRQRLLPVIEALEEAVRRPHLRDRVRAADRAAAERRIEAQMAATTRQVAAAEEASRLRARRREGPIRIRAWTRAIVRALRAAGIDVDARRAGSGSVYLHTAYGSVRLADHALPAVADPHGNVWLRGGHRTDRWGGDCSDAPDWSLDPATTTTYRQVIAAICAAASDA